MTDKLRSRFGILGLFGLVLILPIKALRWTSSSLAVSVFVGVAPSLLAPAGFMFLILASPGRLSRLSLPQITVGMTALSLIVEFAQLLPRPGFLAVMYYTFDWLDVFASLLSVGVGYAVARYLTKPILR